MNSVAALLMGLVGPMLLRALTTLGIGLVTFTGVAASLDGLISQAVQNYQSIPADILGLAGLAGVPQAVGIICGAMVARVGLWVASSATRWITKP